MEDIGEIVYDKIPRETIITVGKENVLAKWQEQWASSTKGAVSKLFFLNYKRENEDHNIYFIRIYGYGNGSRFNQVVTLWIQVYSQLDMPMQNKRRTDS